MRTGRPLAPLLYRMFEIRVHGRGGQGVVTAAELLSVAAFFAGKHAQAFPTFGSERMGAPVTAFCRVSERPIRSREPVTQPDVVIIQDATLLHQLPVFEGLRENGFVFINSTRSLEELGLQDLVQKLGISHCLAVPATQLAVEHVGKPLPNAALLGAFAAFTQALDIRFVEAAIRARFPGRLGEANMNAARAAYQVAVSKEKQHAQAS
jgi:pyruvate ferredoxin oxidoreductase gamma subunit